MRDWYGRTLRVGDYVIYGHPNCKEERFPVKIIAIFPKTGIHLYDPKYGDTHTTFPHNVVKIKNEDVVILKLKGMI